MTASSIGSNIEIGGIPFEVVGILQPKGGSGALSQDDQILVPLTTMASQFSNVNQVQAIFVSVSSSNLISGVQATITSTLDARHRIPAGGQADFNIANQAQLLGTVSSVSGLLTILLAGIASISLVVGGIGIMNIMLVSVRERTREIGIRKAIGAKRSDIMAQFLVEALTLSIVGGVIGIGIGLLASWGIGRFAGWAFTFSPPTILLALGFSLAVGVIFGVWPARQAARLDPVAALRYE
jgi:putative ABC transport system permease protein